MSPVAEADPGKNMPKNIRDRNRSINVAHDLINDNGTNYHNDTAAISSEIVLPTPCWNPPRCRALADAWLHGCVADAWLMRG